MRALISTIVAVSLVGCATRADEIEAAYVSPLQYESFTCKQIGLEIGRVSMRVHEVTGQQEDTADKDAVVMGVGLILFWPALFFLAGGDHEEELARLKGEYDALESAAIQSDCDIADDLEEARRARKRRRQNSRRPPWMGRPISARANLRVRKVGISYRPAVIFSRGKSSAVDPSDP